MNSLCFSMVFVHWSLSTVKPGWQVSQRLYSALKAYAQAPGLWRCAEKAKGNCWLQDLRLEDICILGIWLDCESFCCFMFSFFFLFFPLFHSMLQSTFKGLTFFVFNFIVYHFITFICEKLYLLYLDIVVYIFSSR